MSTTYFDQHHSIIWIFVILIIWEAIWKGIALWRAAKHNQLAWFVILLVVNTVGLLPILYLLLIQPNRPAVSGSKQTAKK